MGKILKVIGIAFLIIILLIGGLFIYFYNFYVFKTIRVCITDQSDDLKIACQNSSFCISFAEQSLFNNSQTTGLPEGIKQKLNEVIASSVFCSQTCKMKKFYGMGIGNDPEADRCKQGETEIKYEIKGKEGLEILNFMRKNKL